MKRLESVIQSLRILNILLMCLSLASIPAGCKPSDQERVSSEILEVLRNDFQMSDVITLIEKSPSRSISQQYLREQKQFNFVVTQSQDPMIVDGYSVGDLKSAIIGYSLFYYGNDGPLVIADTSVNPLNVSARQTATNLLHKSLNSVSTPDGSMLYFLGIYDFDSSRVIKIMIRHTQTPMDSDYAIRYAVSYR